MRIKTQNKQKIRRTRGGRKKREEKELEEDFGSIYIFFFWGGRIFDLDV